MSKYKDKMQDWSEEDLEQSRRNAFRYVGEGIEGGHTPEKIAEAEEHIDTIHKEFERRRELARKGAYIPEQREDGPLSRMGYHVGNRQGVKTVIRRKILERAVTGALPFANPLEMDKWGEPSTEKRLETLAGYLAYFVRKNKRFNDERLAKAIIEWEEDLDWLKETYYQLNGCKFKWPHC